MTRIPAYICSLLLVSPAACISTYRSDVGPFVSDVSTSQGHLVLDRCRITYQGVVDHGPYGGKRSGKLTQHDCAEYEVEMHGRAPQGGAR